MFDEISFDDIKVGNKYLYEEKYYWAGDVEVVEDNSDDICYKFKLKVLKVHHGYGLEAGEDFNIVSAKENNKGGMIEALMGMKFLPVGSIPSYSSIIREEE